ncbi:MAG: ribonuclease III [Bacteroidales bacterium]
MISFFNKNYHHPLSIFIKNAFGYIPKNIFYYELALTHKSASIYHNKNYSINNERLEFLGDAILNAVIGEYLFNKYTSENEGFLSRLRSKIVSRHSLNEIAIKLQLDKVIKQQTDIDILASNIPGNALEAIVGAIFIDKGYDFTKKIIMEKIINPYINWQDLIENDTNYKGKLIDWVQKHHMNIEFKCNLTSINEKQQVYIAEVWIKNRIVGKGMGINKKEAEQQAAKEALNNL